MFAFLKSGLAMPLAALAATSAMSGPGGWEVPFEGLSKPAMDRVVCLQETEPRHAAGTCGHVFAEPCREAGPDDPARAACLWASYQAWHEVSGHFAGHYRADWRAVLASKGYTQTQIFLAEMTPAASADRMEARDGYCRADSDTDTLDQCVFDAGNEAGAWYDLYRKMNGPDR